MSRNLMGLFQRPFMDGDWALSVSFIPFHRDGAFYGLITTLLPPSQNRSIVAKCDFQRFPRPFSR